MPTASPISPYAYLDYRHYLADFFGGKKAANRGFSYRVFCRKAGINSPGLVSEVLAGTRRLSKAYAEKFALGLGLDEGERAFFALMIAYTHAATDAAKRELYAEILNSLPLRVQGLRRSQWEYFSKWYHVAARECLAILDSHDEAAELSRRLRPRITLAQAKSALAALESLDLIGKNAQGRWKARQASLITPGDENESLLFRVYRGEMLARAAEALERFPGSAQTQACTTLSVSAAGAERIRGHIEEFHRRVLETVQADSDEDRVMQLNLQFFPMSGADDAA